MPKDALELLSHISLLSPESKCDVLSYGTNISVESGFIEVA